MDRVYFISDVHLAAHSDAIEKLKISRLVSFLKHIQGKCEYLYIVGDLFDFWFEYRTAIPKINLKIITALLNLIENGTVIRYFTGNHDLWQETYLRDELGLTLYHEPQVFTHNGLKFFIAHGDGLAKGEKKLRFMKRVFKNRINIALYRIVHPDLGIPLAMHFSHNSKKKGPNRFVFEFRDFALTKLNDGFDVVVFGHTHVPTFEVIESQYYVNLGDWVKSFTYLRLTGKNPELCTWNDA